MQNVILNNGVEMPILGFGSREDMERIATLDTKNSCFFSHNDPEIVKWLGTVKFDI